MIAKYWHPKAHVSVHFARNPVGIKFNRNACSDFLMCARVFVVFVCCLFRFFSFCPVPLAPLLDSYMWILCMLTWHAQHFREVPIPARLCCVAMLFSWAALPSFHHSLLKTPSSCQPAWLSVALDNGPLHGVLKKGYPEKVGWCPLCFWRRGIQQLKNMLFLIPPWTPQGVISMSFYESLLNPWKLMNI